MEFKGTKGPWIKRYCTITNPNSDKKTGDIYFQAKKLIKESTEI